MKPAPPVTKVRRGPGARSRRAASGSSTVARWNPATARAYAAAVARDDEAFCYLTTTGRSSGRPRRIEIWFARHGSTLYLLAGGGEAAHWVRNIRRDPAVAVELAGVRRSGRGRVVEEPAEDGLARRLLLDKYEPGYTGSLERWARESLPVAVDLD